MQSTTQGTYKRLQPFRKGLFTDLEIWKPVKGFEGKYEVSNLGQVKSLARTRLSKGGTIAKMQERLLSQKTTWDGYKTLNLSQDSKKKHYSVHRLVAENFIPNPDNLPTVNHKDGDKSNNAVSNLEWASHSDQMNHAFANNLLERRGPPKFTKAFKKEIQEYISSNPELSLNQVADLFGTSQRTVLRIKQEGVIPRTTVRVLKSGQRIKEDILTKEQVAEIKYLRNQGWTLVRLAEKFNRGTSQIHRIVKEKSRTTHIE